MEASYFDSCYLRRDLYAEDMEESHMAWSLVEPDNYLIEFRMFKCCSQLLSCRHGQRQGEVIYETPVYQGGRISEQELIRHPVECLTSLAQYLGLNLSRSDVEQIACYMTEFKNRIRPGTRVMAVAEINVCRIELVPGCVLDADLREVSDINETASDSDMELEDNVVDDAWLMDVSESESEEWEEEFNIWFMGLVARLEDRLSSEAENAPGAAATKKNNVLVRVGYDGVGGDTCSICLNEFPEGQEVMRTMTCLHNFHEECITKWLSRKRDCPLCRTYVNMEQRTQSESPFSEPQLV